MIRATSRPEESEFSRRPLAERQAPPAAAAFLLRGSIRLVQTGEVMFKFNVI